MGYVYAIGGNPGEPVKIGYSERPQERLASLQTGNPSPLRLLATVEAPQGLERRLHEQLADSRLQGEWFRCDHRVECIVNTMMCSRTDDVDKIVALVFLPGQGYGYTKRWFKLSGGDGLVSDTALKQSPADGGSTPPTSTKKGRPRKHESNAERQRAYRERKAT